VSTVHTLLLLAPSTPVAPLAPASTHGVTPLVSHLLSPLGVLATLLLALIVDVMRVGPEWFRDRLAFVLGLAAIREGFQGTALEVWTVDWVVKAIHGGMHIGHSLYIAEADADMVVGVLVGGVALYCTGVLLPVRAAKRVGGFARLSFSKGAAAAGAGKGKAAPGDAGTGQKWKLNSKLWTCAWILGLMADLPQGGVGTTLRSAIETLTTLVASPLAHGLFGA
jgi:hypothetical protein